MKITEVKYGYTFPRGQYESERIDLGALVEEGDDVQAVLTELKSVVHGSKTPVVNETAPAEGVKKRTKSPSTVKAPAEPVAETPAEAPSAKPAKVKEADKPTKYDNTKELHKKLFGEALTEIDPKWKVAGLDKAKATSTNLVGEDFINKEGFILDTFKEKLKGMYLV